MHSAFSERCNAKLFQWRYCLESSELRLLHYTALRVVEVSLHSYSGCCQLDAFTVYTKVFKSNLLNLFTSCHPHLRDFFVRKFYKPFSGFFFQRNIKSCINTICSQPRCWFLVFTILLLDWRYTVISFVFQCMQFMFALWVFLGTPVTNTNCKISRAKSHLLVSLKFVAEINAYGFIFFNTQKLFQTN